MPKRINWIELRVVKCIETQSSAVVARKRGRREWGVSVWWVQHAGGDWWCLSHNSVNVFNATEHYLVVKMTKICYVYFTTIRQRKKIKGFYFSNGISSFSKIWEPVPPSPYFQKTQKPGPFRQGWNGGVCFGGGGSHHWKPLAMQLCSTLLLGRTGLLWSNLPADVWKGETKL